MTQYMDPPRYLASFCDSRPACERTVRCRADASLQDLPSLSRPAPSQVGCVRRPQRPKWAACNLVIASGFVRSSSGNGLQQLARFANLCMLIILVFQQNLEKVIAGTKLDRSGCWQVQSASVDESFPALPCLLKSMHKRERYNLVLRFVRA